MLIMTTMYCLASLLPRPGLYTRAFGIYHRYRIAGIFRGGKLFVVFVVERQTTKLLPTKQYRMVRRSHTYCTATTKIFPRTGPKITAHENFIPRKIPAIRYGTARRAVCAITWFSTRTKFCEGHVTCASYRSVETNLLLRSLRM